MGQRGKVRLDVALRVRSVQGAPFVIPKSLTVTIFGFAHIAAWRLCALCCQRTLARLHWQHYLRQPLVLADDLVYVYVAENLVHHFVDLLVNGGVIRLQTLGGNARFRRICVTAVRVLVCAVMRSGLAQEGRFVVCARFRGCFFRIRFQYLRLTPLKFELLVPFLAPIHALAFPGGGQLMRELGQNRLLHGDRAVAPYP